MKKFVCTCTIMLCMLCADSSLAAIRLAPKSSVQVTPQQISNPKPSEGDICLPMPAGLTMVLRAVCVPATGYLDDIKVHHGVQGSVEGTVPYAERQYSTSMTAPFEVQDIPQAWGPNLAQSLKTDPQCASPNGHVRPYLYFIGKYEISQGQWRAVMEQDTPFTPAPDDIQPVKNISWFDAMVFTQRYSEWLLQNHPEYLPFFQQENRYAFVRLPTELEWEYAARGGQKVSPTERERSHLYPMPEGEQPKNHIVAAVYEPTITKTAPIGSRQANPLGLHDILGNCSEMIITPFQLVAAGELLGGYGGFIIKGGSWRSQSENELHPGRRVEASFYTNKHAQQRDDMGFRIALGTVLSPKDRAAALQTELQQSSTPQTVLPPKDQAAALQKDLQPSPVPQSADTKTAPSPKTHDVRIIIREIERKIDNPETLQRLQEAEQIAATYHNMVNVNEEHMMQELALGAAFSLETAANYGVRCYQLIEQLQRFKELYKLSDMPEAKYNQDVASMENDIYKFVEGIRSSIFYYRNMLEQATRYDLGRLETQLEKAAMQFAHDDGFSQSMQRRFTVIRKHFTQIATSIPAEKETLEDMFPLWLREAIRPYFRK